MYILHQDGFIRRQRQLIFDRIIKQVGDILPCRIAADGITENSGKFIRTCTVQVVRIGIIAHRKVQRVPVAPEGEIPVDKSVPRRAEGIEGINIGLIIVGVI